MKPTKLPAPSFRPNPRLSNPQQKGGLPFWPSLVMLVTVGAVLMFSLWMRTCGLGAAC